MIVNRRRIMEGKGNSTKNYLFFTALEDGTFKFTKDGLYYSTDGTTWTVLTANTNTPLINAGDKIYFKGTLTPSTSSPQGIGTFSSTGEFEVGGNIMSLLFGDEFEDKTSLEGESYAFYSLFNNCTKLTSISDLLLPATILSERCYMQMFYKCASLTDAALEIHAISMGSQCCRAMFGNCTGLVNAPQLSSKQLAMYCYYGMFSNCSSLVKSPLLPASTLTNYCYNGMFKGCSSLTQITCLANTISASHCLDNWVDGVAQNGTFIKDAAMSGWTTGVNGIPNNWTVEDYE